MFKAVITILLIAWLAVNIITSKQKSSQQLASMILSGHCLVGKASAMIFYAPAWFLKAIREIVLVTIK